MNKSKTRKKEDEKMKKSNKMLSLLMLLFFIILLMPVFANANRLERLTFHSLRDTNGNVFTNLGWYENTPFGNYYLLRSPNNEYFQLSTFFINDMRRSDEELIRIESHGGTALFHVNVLGGRQPQYPGALTASFYTHLSEGTIVGLFEQTATHYPTSHFNFFFNGTTFTVGRNGLVEVPLTPFLPSHKFYGELWTICIIFGPVDITTNRPEGSDPLFRLYNPHTNRHLLTRDFNEYTYLASIGWNPEGVAWFTPKTSAYPVHRLFHSGIDAHLFTSDQHEIRVLSGRGWTDEGVLFYCYGPGGVVKYRLFNPFDLRHLHTGSSHERNVLRNLGWHFEGTGFYGMP